LNLSLNYIILSHIQLPKIATSSNNFTLILHKSAFWRLQRICIREKGRNRWVRFGEINIWFMRGSRFETLDKFFYENRTKRTIYDRRPSINEFLSNKHFIEKWTRKKFVSINQDRFKTVANKSLGFRGRKKKRIVREKEYRTRESQERVLLEIPFITKWQ
jgi:hypothetical protein